MTTDSGDSWLPEHFTHPARGSSGTKKAGADADICWWVVDSLVGTDVEAALDRTIPRRG